MSNRDASCESRIDLCFESRIEDLQLLWDAHLNAGEECPRCDGDGGFQIPGHVFNPCSLCGGTGKVDEDGSVPDLGNMYEYGLCFDYVAPLTFRDQEEGYFRYQLSWGGPSDEFRIYANRKDRYHWTVYKLEYWFLDWFDGAFRHLRGTDRELLENIFDAFFVSSGSVDAEYEKAMEE